MPGPPYRHLGPLPHLTAEDLREPVRALLADPTAEVTGWTGEPIGYESWSRASDGLYAVRGTASGDGGDHAWDLVLKQARHRPWTPGPRDLARQIDDGGDAPADWAYWRREALVLGSSLPYAVAGRFAAVRCLGIVPGPGDRLRLWLERADGLPGEAWSARELLDTAQFLGGFHARSLRRPPPSRPWWCRPFLEQAALRGRFALIERVADAETSADPAVRGLFRPGTATALRSLERRHAQAVRTMRSLPAGLVHRDLTPRNLFRTARGTVAIDWGQAGLGPAGEDLATLVLSSAVAADLDAAATLALGGAAAARHAAGTADEGGPCDPQDVALAYRLVAAYHFGLPVVRIADRLLARDAASRAETAADPGTRRRVAVMTALLEEAQGDL
ncbi:phosphotransferase [Streptomyces heilongjiangensis]|uniref:Phosphotransferase n=1 Tax=Streptomyces heilongjiangensis TaxID=945052 RepID=A0ABW1B928_9ACTN|nr:phosphotransferase [Streptomyces heilongjiangensis]MDC2950130.1 phosphotransferase [Streptomyces heilongjiangensis]